MVQRKLDYYWKRSFQPKQTSLKSPCAAVSSFLDLPYAVRYRIYILAGLVRYCPINLNQEGLRAWYYLDKGNQNCDYECYFVARKFLGRLAELGGRPSCHCPALPFSLLYVSRAISEEVSRILYSENSFTIGKSDSWGLKPLRSLSTSALSCLRVLTVRLNDCECLYKGAFQSLRTVQGPELQGLFSCHPLCQHYEFHDKPLRRRARQHAAILQEWEGITSKLAAHCRLESIHLSFVCDTQDIETAHHVVEQLSPIQNVKTCSIRLSHNPSWEHSALARQTACLVSRLPDRLPENKPKTYRIPAEILSHILEHSELIASFNLEWSPGRGLVPFDCCKKCTTALDCCMCSAYHGAYSPSCVCWRLPLSIFLANRQVHDIAKGIFYGQNRFIVLPKGGRLDDLGSCQAAFPALTDFLKTLPAHTTPFLRSLSLVVSLPEPTQGAAFAQLLTKWRDAVRLLVSTCDTKKLRLAVFMGHAYDVDRGLETETTLQSSYQAIMRPLGQIRDLQDLFIYIRWPSFTTTDAAVQYSSQLEKEILGTNYDSRSRGKWLDLPRLWYDKMSREGPVFAADGSRVWPYPFDDDDAYGPLTPPPYIYI